MFLDSIKEMNRLRKEMNKLLSKKKVKYLLKGYYFEKLMFSKLWFSKFKKFATRSVLGSSNSRRYHWTLKLLVAT